MASGHSVVTPARFASGRTFEQYLAFIGTPENLKRGGIDRLRATRRDWTRAHARLVRGEPADRGAGGGHSLAGEPARRARRRSW